jgi:hypothetical protein
MAKSFLSDIPRRTLLWGVAVAVALGAVFWKMGVDYVAMRDAEPAHHAAVTPKAEAASKTPIVVSGFRSAQFGDDEATVRKAIEKDFGLSGDKIEEATTSIEKTRFLAIHVADVVPDSGVAEIVYIFGYKSKALIQVNLIWGSRLSSHMLPEKFAAVAKILGSYFADQGFDPDTVRVGQKMPSGAIRVFSGRDLQGHLVALIYHEGEIVVADKKPPHAESKKNSRKTDTAKPEAPPRHVASLRLSYVANPDAPDVFRIEKGKF